MTKIKFNKKTYEFICYGIWGCVPVDTKWATESKLYQEAEKKLIEEKAYKLKHTEEKGIANFYRDWK